MLDALIVPDIAGALVGWRCWGLAKTTGGIQLVSRGGTIWPTENALEANCKSGKNHPPPGEKCTCGIYALTEQEGLPYYVYDGPAYAVFGQVYLWGEVVRGSMGYRARYAYPKTLYVAHKDWRYAQPLRDSYRVPVALQDPFTSNSKGH